MRICITTFAGMIGLAASAEALTLKTGEVHGLDSEVLPRCLPKGDEGVDRQSAV